MTLLVFQCGSEWRESTSTSSPRLPYSPHTCAPRTSSVRQFKHYNEFSLTSYRISRCIRAPTAACAQRKVLEGTGSSAPCLQGGGAILTTLTHLL